MNDLKFAFRQLLKNPGFTAVAVLTLALGIGASTAIYSVVNTVLLNPIPGPEPERLMEIAERDYGTLDHKPFFGGVTSVVLDALRAHPDLFSDIAWWDSLRLEKKTDEFITGFGGAMVSPAFFRLWNVQPMFGRTFSDDEAMVLNENRRPAADSVIILSYPLWKSLFGGDPAVLGKPIELRGEGISPSERGQRFTVIGVMPPHFQFPQGAYPTFWIPAEDRRLPHAMSELANTHVLVRLKPGVRQQQVEAMLEVLAKRVAEANSGNRSLTSWWQQNHGLGLWIRPLRYAFTHGTSHGWDLSVRENLQQTLFGLLGAIGFVLLIVCVNIANLTLARTERRQQEISVRVALGAGRARLMRQLLTENLLLACLGGLGGLIVTVWGMKLLAAMIPTNMPRLRPIQIDGHALSYALVVSVMAGLIFGLVPAWRASSTPIAHALKEAGPSMNARPAWRRYRGALVIIEVALSLVLLTGAGLMIQSVIRLLHVNPGFDPENLLFVDLAIYDDPESSSLLFPQLRERIAALPGVVAIGFVRTSLGHKFKIDGGADEVQLDRGFCGAEQTDFFRAMRIPLVSGRYFDRNDIFENVQTVIINESMARLCWPGESAVGKRFRWPRLKGDNAFEVIGVVGDARTYSYEEKVRPTFYRPYQDEARLHLRLGGSSPRFIVRTQADPRHLIPAIRKELAAVVPEMRQDIGRSPITVVRQVFYESTEAQRTYMLYLAAFAGVGLLLSAIGIYGVVAYAVARRTREIGIRIAIGAERAQVVRMVMAEGACFICAGVALGMIAGFWLAQLLRRQLFEVSPADPLVITSSVVLLTVVGLAACFIPARRATRINPMEALRYE